MSRCGSAPEWRLYAVATLALYLIPTPIGSNIARMGTFAALPLVTLVCWGRRPRLLALVFLPLLYVGWSPSVRDGIAGDVDNTASTAFYQPLLRFLDRQAAVPGASPFRIEIPFTSFHWEAYEIATRFSLARGWERQLDIRYNHIFYGGRLTAGTYERWLHDNAVRYVAISTADPDYSARAEVRLIDSGLPYLHPVFRSQNWRVYRVADATPIVQAPAVLRRLTAGVADDPRAAAGDLRAADALHPVLAPVAGRGLRRPGRQLDQADGPARRAGHSCRRRSRWAGSAPPRRAAAPSRSATGGHRRKVSPNRQRRIGL